MRGLACGIVFGVLLVGCSSDKGPERFRLNGEAKCDGKPIAFGDVVFTPDGSKGASGPQGFANIRDGKFDTSGEGGKGIAGGPMIIRVTGFTGPGGKLICEHEYAVELPKKDASFEIVVPPLTAPKKAPAPSEI